MSCCSWKVQGASVETVRVGIANVGTDEGVEILQHAEGDACKQCALV